MRHASSSVLTRTLDVDLREATESGLLASARIASRSALGEDFLRAWPRKGFLLDVGVFGGAGSSVWGAGDTEREKGILRQFIVKARTSTGRPYVPIYERSRTCGVLPSTWPSLLFVRMSFARCSLESSFRVGGGGGKQMTAGEDIVSHV